MALAPAAAEFLRKFRREVDEFGIPKGGERVNGVKSPILPICRGLQTRIVAPQKKRPKMATRTGLEPVLPP